MMHKLRNGTNVFLIFGFYFLWPFDTLSCLLCNYDYRNWFNELNPYLDFLVTWQFIKYILVFSFQSKYELGLVFTKTVFEAEFLSKIFLGFVWALFFILYSIEIFQHDCITMVFWGVIVELISSSFKAKNLTQLGFQTCW